MSEFLPVLGGGLAIGLLVYLVVVHSTLRSASSRTPIGKGMRESPR